MLWLTIVAMSGTPERFTGVALAQSFLRGYTQVTDRGCGHPKPPPWDCKTVLLKGSITPWCGLSSGCLFPAIWTFPEVPLSVLKTGQLASFRAQKLREQGRTQGLFIAQLWKLSVAVIRQPMGIQGRFRGWSSRVWRLAHLPTEAPCGPCSLLLLSCPQRLKEMVSNLGKMWKTCTLRPQFQVLLPLIWSKHLRQVISSSEEWILGLPTVGNAAD